MSLFSDIAAEVKAEAEKIKAELASLLPKAKQLIEASAEEIAVAAAPAVVAQFSSAAKGEIKLSVAAANIVSSLGAAGKSVLPALAEGAAQMFYDEVQKLLAEIAPAKPAS